MILVGPFQLQTFCGFMILWLFTASADVAAAAAMAGPGEEEDGRGAGAAITRGVCKE